eukprot:SAG22_NODE_1139_length_5389_cov_1.755577_2_plen_132_part_00
MQFNNNRTTENLWSSVCQPCEPEVIGETPAVVISPLSLSCVAPPYTPPEGMQSREVTMSVALNGQQFDEGVPFIYFHHPVVESVTPLFVLVDDDGREPVVLSGTGLGATGAAWCKFGEDAAAVVGTLIEGA